MVLTVLALKLTSHARVSIGRNVVCSCFSCDEVRVVQGGAGRAQWGREERGGVG